MPDIIVIHSSSSHSCLHCPPWQPNARRGILGAEEPENTSSTLSNVFNSRRSVHLQLSISLSQEVLNRAEIFLVEANVLLELVSTSFIVRLAPNAAQGLLGSFGIPGKLLKVYLCLLVDFVSKLSSHELAEVHILPASFCFPVGIFYRVPRPLSVTRRASFGTMCYQEYTRQELIRRIECLESFRRAVDSTLKFRNISPFVES